MTDPVVSIVTPTYNDCEYLPECVESISSQSYPNIEHIIIDGASSDGTIDWLQEHADSMDHVRWISEPDDSMYDAIKRGFEMATGEIYAWLNADDLYFRWTVDRVVDAFENGYEWITGHANLGNREGEPKYCAPIRSHFHRKWIAKGWYHGKGLGWIQQESTFWSSKLWEKADGFPEGVKLAGDFYLWKQFAEYEDLITVPIPLAIARGRPGQQTDDIEKYYKEIEEYKSLSCRILGILQVNIFYSLFIEKKREIITHQDL